MVRRTSKPSKSKPSADYPSLFDVGAKQSKPICEGEHCPQCNARVIPGLDACYCTACKEWFDTPTGIKMQEEMNQRREAKKLAASSQNKISLPLFDQGLLSQSIAHHEYENDY